MYTLSLALVQKVGPVRRPGLDAYAYDIKSVARKGT